MALEKGNKADMAQLLSESQEQLQDIIGLGKFSFQKSYYPELQKKIKELKLEKDKYQRIFADALNGIFQVELTGRIIIANPAMVRICAYCSLEQISAISDIRTQLFAKPEHYDELISKLQDCGSIIAFETQFKQYNQVIIDVSLNASLQTGEMGPFIECIVQNITKRKQAEASLKEARNYITNIIDSMPSVLIGVDLQGKVSQWNREAHRVTGLSATEALGQSLIRVFPRLADEVVNINAAIETRQKKLRLKKPYLLDGQTRYENLTIYPLVSHEDKGAVVRLDDVSETVRLEELIVQSEKMLSVGGLAAGMAHEINNPLAGMMQTANVMANRLSNKTLAANIKAAEAAGLDFEALCRFMEQRGVLRMIETINQSGQRIADLVDNMLSFSRKSDLAFSNYDMAELLDKTLELAATDYDLKKQYDFKKINIIKQYANDLPLVSCEASKIQQVMLNILRNAAHAMQQAQVKAPRLCLFISYEADSDSVLIKIGDNGPGMDEAIRGRVFEPFYTTKPEGTGLGLSISYFIIAEHHGGELRVQSTPGGGSQFVIRLPVAKGGVYDSSH